MTIKYLTISQIIKLLNLKYKLQLQLNLFTYSTPTPKKPTLFNSPNLNQFSKTIKSKFFPITYNKYSKNITFHKLPTNPLISPPINYFPYYSPSKQTFTNHYPNPNFQILTKIIK